MTSLAPTSLTVAQLRQAYVRMLLWTAFICLQAGVWAWEVSLSLDTYSSSCSEWYTDFPSDAAPSLLLSPVLQHLQARLGYSQRQSKAAAIWRLLCTLQANAHGLLCHAVSVYGAKVPVIRRQTRSHLFVITRGSIFFFQNAIRINCQALWACLVLVSGELAALATHCIRQLLMAEASSLYSSPTQRSPSIVRTQSFVCEPAPVSGAYFDKSSTHSTDGPIGSCMVHSLDIQAVDINSSLHALAHTGVLLVA